MNQAGEAQNQKIDQLQQQINALQHQLIQAQSLSALGELVGTTTHEFNNVLMTIMNYAKLGLRNKDDASRDKAFQRILVASERANKITNTVLGVARNRADQSQPTDLAKIIQESMYLLEREMQKYRISVEVEINDVPQAKAVGNQIQQVLINLMTNARQAMDQGGRMIVRLAFDPEANTVDLSVRDFGPGIETEQLQKIFDPFYSTKTKCDGSGKGGTGIGLSACRQIVETHQGKIRVESTPGKGTMFTIKIPAIGQPAQASAVPSPKSLPGSAQQVVDHSVAKTA